ncbi:MAG: hypothetical protein R2752_03150 [Vicinamibacterales bacterium]
MRRISTVGVFVLALAWSAPAFAQQDRAAAPQRHVADSQALRQAVADQQRTDAGNREVILDVLHSDRMKTVADRLGLDVGRADSAVRTLSSDELRDLAEPARAARTQLAGGDAVVISVTTLLLILILVVLVAK